MPKVYITLHLCDDCHKDFKAHPATIGLGCISVGPYHRYCTHAFMEKAKIVPSSSDDEIDEDPK